MKKYDVIVIGAGLGGLTAALFLASKGLDVAIIEKENYVGGRASSVKHKGFIMDRGAVYLLLVGRYLKTCLARGCIPSTDMIPTDKHTIYIKNGNKISLNFTTAPSLLNSFLKFNLIPKREKFRLSTLRFFYLCLTAFREIKIDYSNWKKYNLMNARDYLSNYFSEKTIDDVFEPPSRTFLLAPLKEVSSAMFFILLGCLLDPKNNLYHPRGGIGNISDCLHKKVLMHEVKVFRAKVTSIQKKNSFIIKCSNGKKYFSRAVVSDIPTTELSKITPLLKKSKDLNRIKYVSNICINIALKKPLNKLKSNHIVFVLDKGTPIVFVGECTSKNKCLAPSGKGLLYTLCSPSFSARYIKKDEKIIMEKIENKLRQHFKDYDQKYLFHKIFKWENALPLLNEDYFDRLGQVTTDVDGLFICGDCVYIGLDGVTKSGIDAAEGCMAFLL